MSRTRIKICGVMRAEDAAAAARAGADAVGIVFDPTAGRSISVAEARTVLRELPPFVMSVGLFVDASRETILETAHELALGCVQLHGAESPEVVRALRPLAVIKAIRVDAATLREELALWAEAITRLGLENLRGIVLETAVKGVAGGTGVANDWETISRFMAEGAFAGLPPVIAAGGLTPASVGDVVRRLRPRAVDVSSGVEEIKGRKSAAKIAAFVSAVREADSSREG